jgi:hypothetical protein
MNPIGEEGNVFSNLFDKVPAKRAGNEEDIAGTVIYLASRAGVSHSLPPLNQNSGIVWLTIEFRHMLMEFPYVLMAVVFFWQMDKSR